MFSTQRGGRRLAAAWMILLACGALWTASLGRAAEDKTAKAKGNPADKVAQPACGANKEGSAKKKQEQAMQEAIEEAQKAYEKEQRELQERLRKDPLWQPSYQQVNVIKVKEEAKNRTVHSFCLNLDGRLLVCCGRDPGEMLVQDQKTTRTTSQETAASGEILVFSPEGKKLDVWKMAIDPQAICVAGDGTIYVGGTGKLYRLDRNGKLLSMVDSPNAAELPPLPAEPEKKPELKGEAGEKAKQMMIAELQKKSQEIIQELQKIGQEQADVRPNDEAARDALEAKARITLERLQAIQEKLQEVQNPTLHARMLRARRRQQLTITGLAVTDQDVFLACMSAKGYGYSVWRTDRDFGDPKKVVARLAGCCGQMDIQTRDGELWVAHNGKHKVERYDRDGKKLASFGKTDRIHADGFGGCCEPKNLRFAPGGELLACESGPPCCVKRFTKDGKFLGVAVVAPWNSGCVRVTTELSGDQGKIFVLNSGENAIHVFAKKPAGAQAKGGDTVKSAAK
jgi:hypothetical protein